MPEIKTTTVQEVEDAIRKFQAESEEEAPKVNDLRTRFELNGAAKAYERCLELLGAVDLPADADSPFITLTLMGFSGGPDGQVAVLKDSVVSVCDDRVRRDVEVVINGKTAIFHVVDRFDQILGSLGGRTEK